MNVPIPKRYWRPKRASILRLTYKIQREDNQLGKAEKDAMLTRVIVLEQSCIEGKRPKEAMTALRRR